MIQKRWKQRFQNYENSFKLLERTNNIKNPSEAEQGGLIQFYEVSFELAWKTLKDYLESEGFIVKSPRQTIKQAFQMEIIEDGEKWLEALDDRNLTTHIYNSEIAERVVKRIKNDYYPLLKKLYNYLKVI